MELMWDENCGLCASLVFFSSLICSKTFSTLGCLLQVAMHVVHKLSNLLWSKILFWYDYACRSSYFFFGISDIWCLYQGKSIEVRQAAGLLLKNNLRTTFSSMPPPFQHYVKSELLPCIGATNRAIRSTVGTVISVLFQIVRVAGWIELFQALHKCLDSNDLDHMEGAMDAIYKVMRTPVILGVPCIKPAWCSVSYTYNLWSQNLSFWWQICEDVPEELDVDVPGLSERPINVFMPRILQVYIQHPEIANYIPTQLTLWLPLCKWSYLCLRTPVAYNSAKHATVVACRCLNSLI